MHATMNLFGCVLAQAGMGQAIGWLIVMLIAVIGGAIAIFILRRKVFEGDAPARSTGLTLHDLRQMHQRGGLTAEEFDAAKRIIVGAAGTNDHAGAPGLNPLTGRPREQRLPLGSGGAAVDRKGGPGPQ